MVVPLTFAFEQTETKEQGKVFTNICRLDYMIQKHIWAPCLCDRPGHAKMQKLKNIVVEVRQVGRAINCCHVLHVQHSIRKSHSFTPIPFLMA